MAKTKISQRHVLHTVMDTNVTKEKTTLTQIHSDGVWKDWLFEIRSNSYWQTRTCTVSMHEVFVYTWVSVTKLYDSRLINSIEVIYIIPSSLSMLKVSLLLHQVWWHNAAPPKINAQQLWLQMCWITDAIKSMGTCVKDVNVLTINTELGTVVNWHRSNRPTDIHV